MTGIVRDTGEWAFDTDVVVVGSGGCGLTAAVAAAQGGIEVVVLEKQARPWSNTARSGGMIPAAGSRFQRAAGIVETPEALAEDIFRKNGYASDREATLHLARTAPRLVEWLGDEVGVALVFIDRSRPSSSPPPGGPAARGAAPPGAVSSGCAGAARLGRGPRAGRTGGRNVLCGS